MKSKLILSITATAIVVCSLITLMSFKSETQSGELIIVKVTEVIQSANFVKPTIRICDGDKIVNTVELDLSNPKNDEKNLLTVTSTLNSLKKEGYTLVATNSSSSGTVLFTNYIFEKK